MQDAGWVVKLDTGNEGHQPYHGSIPLSAAAVQGGKRPIRDLFCQPCAPRLHDGTTLTGSEAVRHGVCALGVAGQFLSQAPKHPGSGSLELCATEAFSTPTRYSRKRAHH